MNTDNQAVWKPIILNVDSVEQSKKWFDQNKQALDLEHAHKNWWQIYEWSMLSFVLRANAPSVFNSLSLLLCLSNRIEWKQTDALKFYFFLA